ncbi:MAG: FCD domain-containing protein [Pseudomonadota bacterium]
MPFHKISSEKISQAVIRQIESLILQGVLRPGDRLPSERDLAERLDVSRPTLREALAELEDRGLIEARPGGGTFIASVLGSAFAAPLIELFATHDTALFDYIAFRRDLEGLAAERAAQNATQADLAIIQRAYERLEKAASKRNTEETAALDADFHRAVVEAAHNVVLMHMMRSLSELLVRGVFYNRDIIYGMPDGRERLMLQHRDIRDAVMARDGGAARRAVEEHMDFVASCLHEAERVRSREEISRLRQSHEQQRAARPRPRRRSPSQAAE